MEIFQFGQLLSNTVPLSDTKRAHFVVMYEDAVFEKSFWFETFRILKILRIVHYGRNGA